MYKINADTVKIRLKRNLWLDKLYSREMKSPNESYFSAMCYTSLKIFTNLLFTLS